MEFDSLATFNCANKMLAQLAFYCGVGYKTAMGMGQARPI